MRTEVTDKAFIECDKKTREKRAKKQEEARETVKMSERKRNELRNM